MRERGGKGREGEEERERVVRASCAAATCPMCVKNETRHTHRVHANADPRDRAHNPINAILDDIKSVLTHLIASCRALYNESTRANLSKHITRIARDSITCPVTFPDFSPNESSCRPRSFDFPSFFEEGIIVKREERQPRLCLPVNTNLCSISRSQRDGGDIVVVVQARGVATREIYAKSCAATSGGGLVHSRMWTRSNRGVIT